MAQHDTWQNIAAFLSAFESADLQNLITQATMEERVVPNPAQQLQDVLLRLRNQSLDRQGAALLQKANQPETSHEQRLQILREQTEIRAKKREPLEKKVL